jgi:hypothetical protein
MTAGSRHSFAEVRNLTLYVNEPETGGFSDLCPKLIKLTAWFSLLYREDSVTQEPRTAWELTEDYEYCYRDDWLEKGLMPPELVIKIDLRLVDFERRLRPRTWLDHQFVEEEEVRTTMISHFDRVEKVLTTTYVYS